MALQPSPIARMYHSVAGVLPDGTVLVAGSNTNSRYNFSNVDFPTELRVERLTPPYLDPALAARRPTIVDGGGRREVGYKGTLSVVVQLGGNGRLGETRVNMLMPPFTTHGISMNQRMLVLKVGSVRETAAGTEVVCASPATPAVAPPGYYLLFVVNDGVPSKGVWIRLR